MRVVGVARLAGLRNGTCVPRPQLGASACRATGGTALCDEPYERSCVPDGADGACPMRLLSHGGRPPPRCPPQPPCIPCPHTGLCSPRPLPPSCLPRLPRPLQVDEAALLLACLHAARRGVLARAATPDGLDQYLDRRCLEEAAGV